jgi:hypothetical protein
LSWRGVGDPRIPGAYVADTTQIKKFSRRREATTAIVARAARSLRESRDHFCKSVEEWFRVSSRGPSFFSDETVRESFFAFAECLCAVRCRDANPNANTAEEATAQLAHLGNCLHRMAARKEEAMTRSCAFFLVDPALLLSLSWLPRQTESVERSGRRRKR